MQHGILRAMKQHVYPLYYIQVLKELEKGEYTRKELMQKLMLNHVKISRALDRLQLDGLVTKEVKQGKEYYKLTQNGKDYLTLLRELVLA